MASITEMVKAVKGEFPEWSEFEILQVVTWSGAASVEEAVDVIRCEQALREAN